MKAIIVNNILKSDFKTQAEVQGFEVFDAKTVLALRKLEKNIIQKSLTEELTEDDEMQLEICKSEVNSLKAANVVSDETLRKELVFYRKKDSDIEKAASHKYFKREGTTGNYKYYYTEAEYKQAKGGGESKESDSKGKVYHSDKYDAKNSRKTKTSTVYLEGTEVVDIYDKGTDTYRATVPVSRFKDSKTDISSTDKDKLKGRNSSDISEDEIVDLMTSNLTKDMKLVLSPFPKNGEDYTTGITKCDPTAVKSEWLIKDYYEEDLYKALKNAGANMNSSPKGYIKVYKNPKDNHILVVNGLGWGSSTLTTVYKP